MSQIVNASMSAAQHVIDAPQTGGVVATGTIFSSFMATPWLAVIGAALSIVLIWRNITITRLAKREHNLKMEMHRLDISERKRRADAIS